MKKVLLLIAAASLMAACGESPTAPAAPRKAAADRSARDLECASGYVVAYDEYGNPYCAPDTHGRVAPLTQPKKP